MGANQSKGQKLGGGGGQRLGSSNDGQHPSATPQRPHGKPQPPQRQPAPTHSSSPTSGFKKAATSLGSSNASSAAAGNGPSDARLAAAEAAERRLKVQQQRGTNSSNPNQGKLASQAAKQPPKATPQREEERLVWD